MVALVLFVDEEDASLTDRFHSPGISPKREALAATDTVISVMKTESRNSILLVFYTGAGNFSFQVPLLTKGGANLRNVTI